MPALLAYWCHHYSDTIFGYLLVSSLLLTPALPAGVITTPTPALHVVSWLLWHQLCILVLSLPWYQLWLSTGVITTLIPALVAYWCHHYSGTSCWSLVVQRSWIAQFLTTTITGSSGFAMDEKYFITVHSRTCQTWWSGTFRHPGNFVLMGLSSEVEILTRLWLHQLTHVLSFWSSQRSLCYTHHRSVCVHVDGLSGYEPTTTCHKTKLMHYSGFAVILSRQKSSSRG